MSIPPSTLSVLIPTLGRETLERALGSVARQLGPDDECIVIGDTHDGPLPTVEARVRVFGPNFRYVAHDAGRHSWGHPQLNHGQEVASKGWITVNDDDDTYTPGAFRAMRAQIGLLHETMPLLFRFVTHYGLTVWAEQGVIQQSRISGHCLVAPNVKKRLGWRKSDIYEADFEQIADCVERWDGRAAWCPEIIAVARPGGG